MRSPIIERERPKSPNIQIYRPQLTSVLSIAHRISGVVISLVAIGLVLWLLAAVAGPPTYTIAQGVLASPLGQIGIFIVTFAFFLHLCAGIRHLVWDLGYGFDLSVIYASGWTAVVASLGLTAAVWLALFTVR